MYNRISNIVSYNIDYLPKKCNGSSFKFGINFLFLKIDNIIEKGKTRFLK